MTHSRLTPTLAALATTLCLAGPASAGHEVVLKDGRHIAAGTRPVMALGRVNFNDAAGRSRSLPAATVNLSATREALRRNGGAPARTVWTAADLERTRETVHLETARSSGTPGSDFTASREGPAPRSSSTQAQIDVLENSLDRVRAQRRTVKAYDTEAEILEERKIVLQSELLRLRTALEIESLQVASAF